VIYGFKKSVVQNLKMVIYFGFCRIYLSQVNIQKSFLWQNKFLHEIPKEIVIMANQDQ